MSRIGGAPGRHSGVACPLPFHQRRSQAIPTTETRAVARGMGSGKCRLEGGRWVINSMGKSPNAICLGCRRIFCRKRLCISSTCAGFSKSMTSSRVSAVVSHTNWGQFTGLSRGIHVTFGQQGRGRADLGTMSAGVCAGLLRLNRRRDPPSGASHFAPTDERRPVRSTRLNNTSPTNFVARAAPGLHLFG